MECKHIESEIVDAGIDDEAIEAQQPQVVAVVDRQNWRSNTMLCLDICPASILMRYVYESR